jgi:hypothetical protein
MEQLALEQRPVETTLLSPMEMIQAAFQSAIENKQGLEVVDRILEQQKWMIQHQEEERFNAALRRIQDKLKPIAKTGQNPETHSKYATAGAIDRAIEGLMFDERMSLTFEPEPHPLPDMVRIVGVLSLGAYARRYPLDMPADGKGAKGGGVMSRTHATGSAITYAKRYLKNMIFNLSFAEKDDDGNRAGGSGALDEKDHIVHLENIQNANNRKDLNAFYIAAIKAAGKVGDSASIEAFEKAANTRIKELA